MHPAGLQLAEQRHAAIAAALPSMPARVIREHVWAAPPPYLIEHEPGTIARHIAMIAPAFSRFEARVSVDEGPGHEEWTVHVAMLDRRGALASIAGVFARHRISVRDASISTWRNGFAVDVFSVHAPYGTDWQRVRDAIEGSLAHFEESKWSPPAHIEGALTIDNLASPWYSIVEIRARDRSGLLHRVASALSDAGASIHQASITTRGDAAADVFWVTGRRGSKLDASDERRLRKAFSGRRTRKRWQLFG